MNERFVLLFVTLRITHTYVFLTNMELFQSSDRFIGHIFNCLRALMVCVRELPVCVSTEYLLCENISLCVRAFLNSQIHNGGGGHVGEHVLTSRWL